MKIEKIVTVCPSVRDDMPLDEALKILRKSGSEALILESGDTQRLVTRSEILDALALSADAEGIGSLVTSTHPLVSASDRPSEVLGVMEAAGASVAGVLAAGQTDRLLGIVSAQDLLGLRAELARAAMRDGLAVVSMLNQEVREAVDRNRRLEGRGNAGRPDPETGLHDARFLNRRLAEECERARRHHRVFSLLLIGMDPPLPETTDSGLEAALCAALRRAVHLATETSGSVRRTLRRADVAAGYGACEYAVLLPETNAADARTVAERIRMNMQATEGLDATFSIGLAAFGDAGRTRGEMVRAARRALEVGRLDGLPLVSAGEIPGGAGSPAGVSRLIRGSRLSVVFQPIMDTRTGKVFAYEALMRTRHPTFSSPPELFAMAERLGGVSALSANMLSMVAERMDEMPAGVRVFINLHPLDFTNVEFIESVTTDERYRGYADRWVFELTECSAISAYPRFMRCLELLRGAGFRTAIDDMGSGYAALTSVVAMNPAYIKLDMALIRNIHQNPTQQNIVRSLIAFARSQGTVEIIAEGVEFAEEQDYLRKIRCSYAQGYFVGRPAERPGAATA